MEIVLRPERIRRRPAPHVPGVGEASWGHSYGDADVGKLCVIEREMLSSEELGDQRRRSRASPNPWLIGLCFDAVIGSKSFIGNLCCSGK